MKLKIIFPIILLIIFGDCKKESNEPDRVINLPKPNYVSPFGYPGEISGLFINNKPWRNTSNYVQVAYGSVFTDTLCRQKENGRLIIQSLAVDIDTVLKDTSFYSREEFIIAGLPLKEGKYLLHKALMRCDVNGVGDLYLVEADGDVFGGLYNLRERRNLENSITITRYDRITGDVYGTFDVTFYKIVLQHPEDFPYYTDEVRFQGGQFHTKWIK